MYRLVVSDPKSTCREWVPAVVRGMLFGLVSRYGRFGAAASSGN